MAAYQSPVRRFSADFLSDKENTPSKEVNRLKNLLKSNTQIADTFANSDADACATHQTDRDDNNKVLVKLKDGTVIKLCKSCATSNIIEDNSQKPPKRQRKPKAKAEKETKAADDTNKDAGLENSTESATAKRKVAKAAKTIKNKANTTANRVLIEQNSNDNNQQVDANQETKQAVKKTAVKPPKRTIKKAQKPSENTTKTQDESNTTNENVANDPSLHEQQDTSVNDNIQGKLEKPVRKTRQRKGKKNTEDVDKDKDQLNDKHEKDDTIDNNSQLSDGHNKSDTINNTLENGAKPKRGKRNNNGTLQKQRKLNNTVGQVNVSKETEVSGSSTAPESINNISTLDSSIHNMEIHSTSLEDNQHGNTSIHQNETIKNNQPMQGNNHASNDHNDKLDTSNNIVEENVTKRHGGKKNKKETADRKKKVVDNSIEKDQIEQPGNSTIEERNENVSTDDPSFNNTQVHSTSLEDNVNTNIYKDETIKINQPLQDNSFNMPKRVKKEPADVADYSVDNHARMFESPKKPLQYQLALKAPESPKKKSKSKKMEQSGSAASCSHKKGKADCSKQQKKKSSEKKKKESDRKDKTVVKVAKAMQKMSHYYAKAKLGKTFTESDLSTTESESSSSECSSSCSCRDESSSGDDCRCWNCLMQDSSDDSSWTETSSEESDESDTSDSSSSSSSSETCNHRNNGRRACNRYNLRMH